MSVCAAANGVKRGASELVDGGELKRPRREEEDAGEQRPTGTAAAGEAVTAGGADHRPADDAGAERWKLKKVLLLVSYSGKGYQGMQRNPGIRTIEEELLTALHRARAIPDHGLREQQSIWFQRAARTDKGVSAAKQSVSLKMVAEDGILEAVNAHLPAQIRVFDMKRVTKRFDAKLQCCARTYHYVSPSFAFSPSPELISEQYRMPDEVLSNVNRLFEKYTGTHNYHNFTSRRKPNDPSNKRYVMEMGCSQPFVRRGVEFVVITVKGQSFMLHQIRKMVGVVMAVAQGHAEEGVFERAWSLDRIDLPVAPALGLLLHEVHYDRYNQRFGSGGSNTHDNIEWSAVEDKVRRFTDDFIYADIVRTELEEKPMLSWLRTLPLHTFDIREGDLSPPPGPAAAADRSGSQGGSGQLAAGQQTAEGGHSGPPVVGQAAGTGAELAEAQTAVNCGAEPAVNAQLPSLGGGGTTTTS
ncbi:tRNA pseudouridine synthase A-like [Pollicipes pollicipes]|uniref:tRNA pseudouridine synthase A-like n=1 Tax=Pollicipes pollicipes TaxID=41117 RepID=UPI0018853CE4|nr:tRNA pseudouridine synthase A-like [Pollicipes pollicipes]XP_037092695.1 tRNA pseudouridine synthase A-like [Pollicipes pollicipes]XP_037092696.1 tRNA pseudouridine synthase A-like [Pollicipes pollicipes]XP_037092697.1 tRNA pseudouridine synthase A-like [Pollicipes pollicipes]